MSIHKIAGIDYGNGAANIDVKTGIRYGVINLHDVCSEFLEDFEAHYPETEHAPDCTDHDCCNCGDELNPTHFTYNEDGLICEYSHDSSMNIMFVFKSPVIVACKFCSPCCPGAGDLNNPVAGGIETYGLPDDCLNKYDY